MPSIDFKDAIRTAKATLTDLFDEEPLKAVALEEIELVEQGGRELWAVTLGFHQRRSVSALSTGIEFFSSTAITS